MKTFDLTPNELSAAFALVEACLEEMGGKRPSDLERDEFTWISVRTLCETGLWTWPQAKGTLSSLDKKGFVQIEMDGDREASFVTTDGWRWLDTVWDSRP
ncbi:hypothetical protein WV31_10870 [Magnetospirillum sp. ME-1]|uniref:hypothetical protein n=1 Tax=Magnetospirillum sp. ME-1 TaxID=1639348 RepID=UPI000A17C5CE|nr:hypothetical protein [Magnetospirillum sp. ME-1]ARJ66130.1 hypothetical protein WV31_10870 [Magnetospirillum sp. ME-1]